MAKRKEPRGRLFSKERGVNVTFVTYLTIYHFCIVIRRGE